MSGLVLVAQDLIQAIDVLVSQSGLVLDEGSALGEQEVVGINPSELKELPKIPLSDTHVKGIDVLVHLIQKSDGLDDHVVGYAGVEFDLGVRIRVTQIQLSLLQQTAGQRLHELDEVVANAYDELRNATYILI